MASRGWLLSITAFGLTVCQAPAVAQDASALAKIQETRAGGQKACATGRNFRIAFSHSISEAAIVKAVRRFADVRAAELGCVTMLHDNTQANNVEQQIDAVKAWVTQGVDAIVVTPIDERALKPLQLEAQKKGIKWLTYLGKMDQSDGYVSFSHSQSGQIVANAAVKWVKDNQIKEPIALVTTLNGLPSLSPRWTEVERIFAANGIRIVATNDQESADQTSGLKAAETALKQHPNLSIIIGLNDESALGALQAVERAGIAPTKIFVAGQDGLQEGLAAVNQGGAYKASAAILINELGANIVDQALNAIAGTGPTVVETPTVLASKSDQPLLDKLIENYRPTAAVTPAQEAAIKAGIKELSSQWSTAYLKNDTSILERIWAPEFVYVEPSGRRFTKAEGVAALKARGEKHTVSKVSSIDVRVYGGGTVAVDIGDYAEAGTDKDGRPFERRTRFTNVWVLKDGAWQCVTGHASAIPAKP